MWYFINSICQALYPLRRNGYKCFVMVIMYRAGGAGGGARAIIPAARGGGAGG